jgi:hypothetical protein
MADHSVTIAANDTAEDAAGFDPARKSLYIRAEEANTDDVWVAFGENATQASPAYPFKAGAEKWFGEEWRSEIIKRISVIGKENDVVTIHSSGV